MTLSFCKISFELFCDVSRGGEDDSFCGLGDERPLILATVAIC